jgi:pyridoxine kinase
VKILSIQSAVAHGHVGNSAAVFPLQRVGHEVLPVFTVQFSNHTGYGAWRGPVLSGEDVAEVILGIEERGVLGEVDLVLSGYQGSPAIAAVILDAVARVKAANPAASYACDPVMGNARSGCFVDPAIPVLIRDQVVPAADVITPNQFELAYLTGAFDGGADVPAPSLAVVLDAVAAARALGPETVLVTSVDLDDQPEDEIAMLAVTGQGGAPAQHRRPGAGTRPDRVQRLRPAGEHLPVRLPGTAAGRVAGDLRPSADAVRRRAPRLT